MLVAHVAAGGLCAGNRLAKTVNVGHAGNQVAQAIAWRRARQDS
jgi:hypothetical protein